MKKTTKPGALRRTAAAGAAVVLIGGSATSVMAGVGPADAARITTRAGAGAGAGGGARPGAAAAGGDGVLRFGPHSAGRQARTRSAPSATPASPTASSSPSASPTPSPVAHPLAPGVCRTRYGAPCYGVPQLGRAYGLDRLHRAGLDGKGEDVVLIMPFHDPRLRRAVGAFSREYGLGPARLRVIRRGHAVQTVTEGHDQQVAAAVETELDVQMIRTTAPGARITVIEVDGQWGPTSDMSTAADTAVWAARHLHPSAISMSYGWAEPAYREAGGGGVARLRRQDAALRRATRAGTTLLAATGDAGPTAWRPDGTLYRHRAVNFPASSPWVVGVSGTQLHLTDSGARTSPDTVWSDTTGTGTATGGGVSDVFTRAGARRALGDVSMVGSSQSRVWFFTEYAALAGQAKGWDRVAGTSVSAPLMAGLVAVAAQRAGHRLGNLTPALHRLARLHRMHGAQDGVADITRGCNTANKVPGYCAKPGADAPSGIGTVRDATRFVTALAR